MMRTKATRFLAVLSAGTILISSSAFAHHDAMTKAESFAGAFIAGRVAGQDKHINLAIDYFNQALAFEPDNIFMQQDMLLTLLSAGDFKQAVKLAKTLQHDTDIDRFVRLTLASDGFIKKSYKTAKKEIKPSQSTDVDRLMSHLISSWATFGQGNRKQAASEIKQLLGPAWFDIFTSFHLALMNDLAGNKKEAERYYKQALNDQRGGMSAPDTYERVIVAYASFQLRHKKRDDALKTLRQGETLLSGRDALKYMRENVENGGTIDRLVKTPQEAAGEVLYDTGTAINRGSAESFARIILQLSLALRPQNDATLFQLADISTKLGDYKSAIEYYKNVQKTSPYYRDSELRLALSYSDFGDNEKALNHLVFLEEEYPDDRRISLALAGIYMQEDAFEKTEKVMDRTIDQIPQLQREDWLLFYQRGIARERMKEWQKAEPDFRQALELFPNQPQVLNYLGYSLIDRNEKLDEALNMVKKAADLRPDDGYIVDSLGWAYFKLGQFDEAVTILERAVQLLPGDPTINDHLGDAYWHIGRKLEATFQWNHAIAGKPTDDELEKIEEKLKTGLKTQEQSSNVEKINKSNE
ncbi:tetratricopeptide repeat protein [Bartonella tamiae]|uniref:Tetratricopeptide repeat protein n=1 Tax=Bartonella tamiae Th239 TaxID=1094558 RepID=J0ZPJ1_9HYPH|nr:tetratricopeptide repeat protein [Bartonella tamiae]EJF90498.1 hypothetical protein ME5_00899 [Bartonella tamiae Th239]EJF93558.1 hypothetical protein MEG_00982 [Bartonella tamiae Th307]